MNQSRSQDAPTLDLRKHHLLALMLLALLAWLFFWVGFHPAASVRHQYNNRSEADSWVWVDAITRSSLGQFDGFVRLPDTHQVWLEDSLGAAVTFTVDQAVVYSGSSSGWVTFPTDAPSVVPFTLNYSVSGSPPPQGVLSLDDPGLLGLRYPLPAWRYLPSASADDLLPHLARLAFAVLAVTILILIVTQIRLPRALVLTLLAVFALSLIARVLTLDQKFSADPTLWTMDKIWDNYVIMGRNWLAGRDPVGGNFYQQGAFIYLGMLQYLIGPSLTTLYIFHALIGSLVALFVAWTGWLLFDRWTGLIAGVFTALYAPLIHYQQTLQDIAPVILIVSLVLFTLALYYRYGGGFWVLISAVLIGLGASFRTTLLILLLAVFVAVLFRETRLVQRFRYAALAIVAALLCIFPITAANLVAGVPTLTANLLDYQLFRSNNLDSVGLNTVATQSEELATLRGDSWRDALIKEIRLDPLHLVELTARRVALFWDATEHSDSGMVDYQTTGLDVSPLLNTLALNGAINDRLLMVLALIGVGVALINTGWRRPILLLAAALAAYILSLAAFYVIGRVRIPISVIALLLAAVAVREGIRLVRQPRRRQIATFAAACLCSIGIGFGMNFAIGYFPRPTFVAQPPADLSGGQATFGGQIRLLGYTLYESDYKPGGYLTFYLYWQALQAPTRDAVVSLRFANSLTHQTDASPNFTLGTLSVPPQPSSTWSAGSIFYERYVLRLPSAPAAYDLYIGLYDPVADHDLVATDSTQPIEGDHVRLTGISAGMFSPASATTDPPLAVWGSALNLESAACQPDSDGTTAVHLNWTLAQRPPDAMKLFVHLWRGTTLVGENDAPPLPNSALDAVPPGSALNMNWQIASSAPAQTAEIGLYDSAAQRWPVLTNRLPSHDNVVVIPCAGSG